MVNKGVQDMGFIVRQGEKGPIIDGSYKGIHLAIFPQPQDSTSYEVHITGETSDGKPDWSSDFNSTVIDAAPDDIEEAADMYMGG